MKLSYSAENLDITKLNYEDQNLYLKGCFFKVKTPESKGKFEWKKIYYCEPEGVCFYGDKEKTIKQKELTIDFTFPSSGVYNYKDSTLVFQRTHKRQWRKGICEDTCIFFNPIKRYYITGTKEVLSTLKETPSDFKFSPKTMKDLFDSSFPVFSKAYDSVKKGKSLSRALCPELFLSMGASGTDPIFWCGLTPVGVALSSTKIKINFPEFISTIQDIFQEIGEKNVEIEQAQTSV